ncbi:heterokaryon incompatibility protein-domain-containing protein, partial [Leptodontidium sp. 2 PMI_412]
MYRFRDSAGQNMASVCVWPTKTNDNAGMNKFFRKFCISHLNVREKNNIMARRNNKSHTISQESLHQIKAWQGACCKDHSTCRDSWTLTSKERRMPTRLLEIIQLAEEWQVRVIDGTEAEVDATYMTLSHCWGSSDFVRLTSENRRFFRDNVPFGSLSQTFKNAVELTFALGFKYLWIDSLCIIQDSHDDWVQESSVMGSVYAQGHLNIAATYSKNGEGGLFNQSNELSASPCIIQMTDNDEKLTEAICYEDRAWHREVDATPLGNRAWVVQERVLAPRILHFSSNQLFWECCRERAAELLPPDSVGEDGELKKVAPYPGTSETQDPERTWIHTNWASLVEKYSSCSLTVQSDKLVAISGLARRVCGQLGLNPQDYVAGLWKSNLLYGLLYRVEQESALPPKRFPGRAPSWSWASLNG